MSGGAARGAEQRARPAGAGPGPAVGPPRVRGRGSCGTPCPAAPRAVTSCGAPRREPHGEAPAGSWLRVPRSRALLEPRSGEVLHKAPTSAPAAPPDLPVRLGNGIWGRPVVWGWFLWFFLFYVIYFLLFFFFAFLQTINSL